MLNKLFFESLLKISTDPIDENYVPRKTNDEVAKAPCESCQYNEECKTKLLACQHYAVWMDSRIPKPEHRKVPDKKTYNRIFN